MPEDRKPRPKRVLIAVTDTRRGGTPLKLATLARQVRERGWDPLVVSVMPGGAVLEELRHDGIATASLDLSSILGSPRAILKMRRLIRSFSPNVIQSALWHANFVCRIAAIRTRTPVVSGHESVDDDKPRWQTRLDRVSEGLVSVHYAISEAVATRVSERDGVPREKITVIPVGKSPEEWTLDGLRANARSLWGIPPSAQVVGWVGRLHPVKDLELLFKAVGSLDGWWLMVVGDGPERTRFADWANRYGIADRLVLAGELADVRPALAAFDVFCLTSKWEGLPAALMEAMAAGLPVVAPAVGGIPELVSHKKNGLLVRSREPTAIGRAILEAATLPELGKRAAETVGLSFPTTAMVDAFKALWESTIRSSSTSPRQTQEHL